MKKLMLAVLLCFSQASFADSFYVANQYLEPKDYYDDCFKECPTIEYTFIQTNHSWIDALINKVVIENLNVGFYEENSTQAKQWQRFADNNMPTKKELTHQLNSAIDELVTENNEWLKTTDSSVMYSVSSTPLYLGHKTTKHNHQLELFSVSGYHYTGGAHGLGWTEYFVLDTTSKRPLNLDDILVPNRKDKLEKLAHAKYIDYLKDNDIDPKDMAETWDFYLTENVTFTQDGITLLYQPYAITPYVMGMPELTVNYSELIGVVKPEYLSW